MAEAVKQRYPGAGPFEGDPVSRKLFHGREQESAALTQQIIAHRLVVLFARSGLGKTSLLKAAVAPSLLEEGFMPLIVRVDDLAAGPLAGVYRQIEDECARQGVVYRPGAKVSAWHFFKTAQFWKGDQLLVPVLMIDQGEELFTLQPPDARDAFVGQFAHVIRGVRPPEAKSDAAAIAGWGPLSDSPPPVRIVVAIREEFLGYLEELSDRVSEVLAERFRLLPLSREAARRAIEQPSAVEDEHLETRPFTLEPQAREAILDFLEHRALVTPGRPEARVEPFQLQLICQRVERIAKAKAETSPGPVTVSLDEIGGAPGLDRILRDFYEQQIAAIPSVPERRRARRVCSEFLINGEGWRVKQEESQLLMHTGIKRATLQALVASRILRVEQSAAGRYYELSHDSLIAPVLNATRAWFGLRTASLVIGVTFGALIVVLGALGIVGTTILSQLTMALRVVVLLVLAMTTILMSLYVKRSTLLLREMYQMYRRATAA